MGGEGGAHKSISQWPNSELNFCKKWRKIKNSSSSSVLSPAKIYIFSLDLIIGKKNEVLPRIIFSLNFTPGQLILKTDDWEIDTVVTKLQLICLGGCCHTTHHHHKKVGS